MEPKKRKRLWTIVATITLVVVFGLIFGFVAFKNLMIAQYMRHYVPPPASVSVVSVQSRAWHPYIASVGNLQAIQGVNVSPQVAGVVTKIYFKSGQVIQQGQPLVTLDTDVLEAQLNRYKATANLAKIDYDRQAKLYRDRAIAQSTYDSAFASLAEDMATVKQYEALLRQKTIVAPFTGKVGIRLVSLGQYLSAGDTITNLQMLNPIYLNYFVPEQDINKLYLGQKVEISVDAYPGKVFIGKIHAIDAQASTETKSMEVQAIFGNTDNKAWLYPGMYTQVKTILPQQKKVVTVPEVAIDYTLYGDSVFVIVRQKNKSGKQETIAKKVYITTGEAQQNEVPVIKGLKAGQQVVVQGQIKLQSNTPVKIIQNSK